MYLYVDNIRDSIVVYRHYCLSLTIFRKRAVYVNSRLE